MPAKYFNMQVKANGSFNFVLLATILTHILTAPRFMMRHIREKKMLHNQQQSSQQQLHSEPQMLPQVRPPDLSQEQVQKQQPQHSFVLNKMNKESLFRFVVYLVLAYK